jgi:hypothetical protein
MNTFISKFKNVYSKKSCESLIDWFEKNKEFAKPGGSGLDKTLSNLEICIHLTKENNFFGLDKTLIKCTEKFIKKYPETNKFIGKWYLDPLIQLACYEPKQFYTRLHCENDGNPKYLNRVFAWMLFLNTIEKGGGTYFKYQNFIAKPLAGDLYIWPAGWTHFHKGIKATQQKKYILTGWYNYLN